MIFLEREERTCTGSFKFAVLICRQIRAFTKIPTPYLPYLKGLYAANSDSVLIPMSQREPVEVLGRVVWSGSAVTIEK